MNNEKKVCNFKDKDIPVLEEIARLVGGMLKDRYSNNVTGHTYSKLERTEKLIVELRRFW